MHRRVSLLPALHASTLLKSEISIILVVSLVGIRLKHFLKHGTFEKFNGLPEVDDNVEGIQDDVQPRDDVILVIQCMINV